MIHKYFFMIFRQVPVHSSLLLGAAAMALQERKASRLIEDLSIPARPWQLRPKARMNAQALA